VKKKKKRSIFRKKKTQKASPSLVKGTRVEAPKASASKSKVKKEKKKREAREYSLELLSNEIIGLIFVFFGIMLFLCLFGVSMGSIGATVNQVLHGLLGYCAFLIPLASVAGGIACMIAASRPVHISRIVCGVFAVFFIVLFLQTFSYHRFDDTTLATFMKDSYNKGMHNVGTGALTSIAVFYGNKFFGLAGVRLVSVLVIVLCSLIVANFSIVRSVERLKERGKARREEKKEEPEEEYAEDEIDYNDYALEEKKTLVVSRRDRIEPGTKAKASDYIPPERPRARKAPEEPEEEIYVEKKGERLSKATTDKVEKMAKIAALNAEAQAKLTQNVSVPKGTQTALGPEGTPTYIFPSIDLLEKNVQQQNVKANEDEIIMRSRIIQQTLEDFGVSARIINVTRGPSITRYELQPAPGVKMQKFLALSHEFSYALETSGVRIEAPIPNKAAVGIEVPNRRKSPVSLRELLETKEFRESKSLLSVGVGKDIAGETVVADFTKMPHALIAGATGSGKSVFMNVILISLLYKASPYDLKLILIDPKRVEFKSYNNLPHLLFPVVTNAKRAASVLEWAVHEMEERYTKMEEAGARDHAQYNNYARKNGLEKMPLLVIMIDELAELMVVAKNEVEESIYRLAQMARAAGMHLIIATQRPSVDVLTGVIKSNIPSRIAFAMASSHDSKTILDSIGAEQLQGKGDMLYLPQDMNKPARLQSAFVSTEEVNAVVSFIKAQGIPAEEAKQESLEAKLDKFDRDFKSARDADPLLEEAIRFVVKEQEASVSMLQRRFRIGHARAGTLIDEMEQRGIVSEHLGSKPREVLISQDEFEAGFVSADKLD